MKTIQVSLPRSLSDMAQEEVRKQVPFISSDISGCYFEDGGATLIIESDSSDAAAVETEARAIAMRVERALRNIDRKVIYQSPRLAKSEPKASPGEIPGAHSVGPGQFSLSGVAARLYSYFDRLFQQLGMHWNTAPVITPTLIPATVLAKCDYFRSFPHTLTFATHLVESTERVKSFRERHGTRETLDDATLADLAPPQNCLSPAVCYHVYHLLQGSRLSATTSSFGVCGKCFRYEGANLCDLRRLWDFTMREIVFVGERDEVLAMRDESIELMGALLEQHELAAEIRTASDPFFAAPDALGKTFAQLTSETKFEISLELDNGERSAVGSHNYHNDFFGRKFEIETASGNFAHSVCVAFGLERWVQAFVTQHGPNLHEWPEIVRGAPEFCGVSTESGVSDLPARAASSGRN
jgi:seryl-tRNA synthetase